jgi:hypothetical protein
MHDLGLRILLAILAFGSAVVGVWAQLFPRSFYDSVPGMGRHWVAVDGPYNEHLVRDVGGLNLALTVVLVSAAVTLSVLLVRVASVAYFVYAVPHLTYHLHHLGAYDTTDQIANAASLAGVVLIPLALLILTRPMASDSAGRSPTTLAA